MGTNIYFGNVMSRRELRIVPKMSPLEPTGSISGLGYKSVASATLFLNSGIRTTWKGYLHTLTTRMAEYYAGAFCSWLDALYNAFIWVSSRYELIDRSITLGFKHHYIAAPLEDRLDWLVNIIINLRTTTKKVSVNRW